MHSLSSIKDKFLAENKPLEIPAILNDSDYAKASDSIAFFKKYFDYAEQCRKIEVAPLVEAKRKLDGDYGKFTKPLQNTIDNIKVLMSKYASDKRTEQLKLEAEASATAESDLIIVDNITVDKMHNEFSTSTVKQVTKFRMKDEKLRFIDLPVLAMREYVKTNKLPDFIESYEEDSVIIRSKV